MTRIVLLDKLHRIPVSVSLVVLPTENAYECQYITPKGTKNEWIGMEQWPAYVIEDSTIPRKEKYVLELGDRSLAFNDYNSFEEAFVKEWIGEVTPWEDYGDEALEYWLEFVSECEAGIPLFCGSE